MDHTILPANTQCLPFLRKRSPDGATRTEVRDIQLQLTTHLSTPKGWQAELAWLVDLWRTVYPQLQVERRTRKLREVVCSCAKVSSVTGLSRYGTCCQHQLWSVITHVRAYRSNWITHRENFAQPYHNFCRSPKRWNLDFYLSLLNILAVVSKRNNISCNL